MKIEEFWQDSDMLALVHATGVGVTLPAAWELASRGWVKLRELPEPDLQRALRWLRGANPAMAALVHGRRAFAAETLAASSST